MRRRTGNRLSLCLAGALLAPALLAAQEPRQLPWRPDSLPDSTVVQSPLPGGAAAVFRFLFNAVPQWLQIAGVVVGAIVALVLVVLAFRHWQAVLAWLQTRSRGYKIALGTTALVLVTAGAGMGLWSWNFMMHDNDFCVGCHVMTSAYQKFGESEHVKLECHDCHRQSIFASMKELYVWVKERPEEIPEHGNSVPNAICAECHIKAAPDSLKERITKTAGHQVHLNQASPLLSKVECVTCHATEIHRWKPAALTCGQAGCHDDINIRLGKMANQSSMHCAACHEFTAESNEALPVDSSKVVLTPGKQQCSGCHEMKQAMDKHKIDQDPHLKENLKCGACHNPHEQTTPAGAFQTCSTGGCHSNADTLATAHKGLKDHKLEDCGACHVAHTWSLKGDDCESCHRVIRGGRDDIRTIRRSSRISAAPSRWQPHGVAVTPVPATGSSGRNAGAAKAPHRAETPSPVGSAGGPAGQDGALPDDTPATTARAPDDAGRVSWRPASFARTRDAPRTRFASASRGAAVRVPRLRASGRSGTAIARGLRVGHDADTTSRISPMAPATAAPAAEGAPQGRQGKFDHRQHEKVRCLTCHGNEEGHGDLKPIARPGQCQSCHHGNTATGRDCASCHTDAEIAPPRVRTERITMSVWNAPRDRQMTFEHARHEKVECASCHAANLKRTVEKTCASCHADHHEATRQCTACHTIATPTRIAEHQRPLHVTGCAGSGCHTADASTKLEPARNVCLSCHAAQKDHKPGEDCATCHLSDWKATAASAGGAR